MTSPLLGTNAALVFTAADLDSGNSQVVDQQTVYDGEMRIVSDLLSRFSSRREQAAEWTRRTGKSRRTFQKRMAACGRLGSKNNNEGT